MRVFFSTVAGIVTAASLCNVTAEAEGPTCRQLANAGMVLISKGKLHEGWENILSAVNACPKDMEVARARDSMAFEILSESVDNETTPAGMPKERFLNIVFLVLRPYTDQDKGLIANPVTQFDGERGFRSANARILRFADVAPLLHQFEQEPQQPAAAKQVVLIDNHLDLKAFLGQGKYRSYCMFFNDEKSANLAYTKLREDVGKQDIPFPIVIELLTPSRSAKLEYGITSPYLIATSVLLVDYDGMWERIKTVDSDLSNIYADSQGNGQDLMSRVREASEVKAVYHN